MATIKADKLVCIGGARPNVAWGELPEVTPVNAVAATRVLTVSDVPATTKTVTIGTTVYTWKTALSTGPTVAYEVLIGVSAEASIDNLVLAINAGSGAGTNYSTGTVAHPTVSAAKTTAATMTVTAKTKGSAANSTALAESDANTSWASATLTGGVDSTVAPANYTCADGTYLYHSIAESTVSTQNWRRVSLGSAY